MQNSFWYAGAILVPGSALVHAQTPSFAPGGTFKGSSLTEWHQAGDAKWSALNGEITGPGNGSE